MKKKLILLMVLCLMLPLVACKKEEPSGNIGTPPDNMTQNDDFRTQHADYLNELPERNYSGTEFRVLTSTQTRKFYLGDETNVAISEAVMERDAELENRYGVIMDYTVKDGNSSGQNEYVTNIRNSVSDSLGYDLIIGQTYYCMALASEGYFKDLNGAEYLHLDQEWYHQNINANVLICGKMFGVSGDYLTSQISSAMGLLYNKDMYNDRSYEYDLYELVRNKQWTLEKMKILIQDVHDDLNRDEIRDVSDKYGFFGNGHSINSLIYGFNCPIVEYQEDGSVSINNYYNDHLISVFEALDTFFNSNEAVFRGGDSDNLNSLVNGNSLFISTWIDNLISERMRNSGYDIGVLPNPLFDEAQENYCSYMQRWDLMYIPKNADFEKSTIILEYLNFTSAEHMIPRYWDEALSTRGANEAADGEMLEIIRDTLFYDFAMVFNTELGGLKDGVAYLISSRSNTLSSWWEKNGSKYADSLTILQMFYE